MREALADAAREAGRKPEDVTLVAVSKLHPASDIRALAETGQMDFGENYVQEALGKLDELADLDVNLHFIGGLQSNKAKFVAGISRSYTAWIHVSWPRHCIKRRRALVWFRTS